MVSAEPLDLTLRREGTAVVLEVRGEVDIATASQLDDGLTDLIEHDGSRWILVDLRGVAFMGAAGLTVLVGAQQRIRSRNGRLALADPGPPVRRVLDATGMAAAFETRATSEVTTTHDTQEVPMAQAVRDVMTSDLIALQESATLGEAAREMRDRDVGDVLVEQDGQVRGIVTDRDIVVRAIAAGLDPSEVRLGEVCSSDLTTMTPDDSVEDAVRVMREKALRRLPVCEDGRAVGIVSLGDLAVERDPESALADISAAPPNT